MNTSKNRKTAIIRAIFAFIAVVIIVCSLNGCASSEREELAKVAPELISRSRELLDLIYRDGLPYDTDGQAIKKGFLPVSEEAEVKTKDELLNALSEVFTVGYVSVISNTAFTGVNEDEGRLEPRYVVSDIDGEEGKLYINTEYQVSAIKRDADIESFKILKCNRYMATAEMTMSYDGKSETDTFTFRKENGKWKLDTAAY